MPDEPQDTATKGNLATASRRASSAALGWRSRRWLGRGLGCVPSVAALASAVLCAWAGDAPTEVAVVCGVACAREAAGQEAGIGRGDSVESAAWFAAAARRDLVAAGRLARLSSFVLVIAISVVHP